MSKLHSINKLSMDEYLPQRIYTAEEAAHILRVSKQLVYDLIKEGLLVALKLGRLKVTSDEIDRFVKKYEGKDMTDLKNIKDLFPEQAS